MPLVHRPHLLDDPAELFGEDRARDARALADGDASDVGLVDFGDRVHRLGRAELEDACVADPFPAARVDVDEEKSLGELHCAACGKSFRVVAPWDAEAPARVGRFELLEKLGAGSFGTVWRARDTKLDREVAVKVPRRPSLDPLEIEEVMREARVAADCDTGTL